MEGLVTKNTGSRYIVRTENGDSIRCKIKGNFRLKGIRSTNPVSVGDLVDIELNPDQTAFITRIHERKNYIIRRSSNLSKESHIIAANIDYALLIVTVNTPPTSTPLSTVFLPQPRRIAYLYASLSIRAIHLPKKTGNMPKHFVTFTPLSGMTAIVYQRLPVKDSIS